MTPAQTTIQLDTTTAKALATFLISYVFPTTKSPTKCDRLSRLQHHPRHDMSMMIAFDTSLVVLQLRCILWTRARSPLIDYFAAKVFLATTPPACID